MIQAAEPNEIVALVADDIGRVFRRELPSSEFGFQGWTVEEILTDVMGMRDTRSEKYRSLVTDFEAALDSGERSKAEQTYEVLDRFLHPNNVQRKLFKLELGRIAGGVNDQAD